MQRELSASGSGSLPPSNERTTYDRCRRANGRQRPPRPLVRTYSARVCVRIRTATANDWFPEFGFSHGSLLCGGPLRALPRDAAGRCERLARIIAIGSDRPPQDGVSRGQIHSVPSRASTSMIAVRALSSRPAAIPLWTNSTNRRGSSSRAPSASKLASTSSSAAA